MRLLKIIDDNLLKTLLAVFVFFIPLYPKFPFQVVNYTYIAIRLDDFMVAIVAGAFFLQVARGKVKLKKMPFLKPILAFWLIVFVSFLSGLYITETIPETHRYVGFLHAARRVQYMMIFFIAVSAIKSVRDFKFLLYALIASLSLIGMYSIGQRFFQFPAISTMNPEYSKGRILFLTPEARLSSTFAGHYDLAAYIVFLLPILWSVYFYLKQIEIRMKERATIVVSAMIPFIMMAYSLTATNLAASPAIIMAAVFTIPFNQLMLALALGTIIVYMALHKFFPRWVMLMLTIIAIGMLVLTASRTSSIAFVISTSLFMLYFRKFRYFILILAIFLTSNLFDNELVNRWVQTVQIKQILINEKTGQEVVVQKLKSNELPAGTAFVRSGREAVDDELTQEARDELLRQASLAASLNASAEGQIAEDYEVVPVFAADVSISTRLQASWPRATTAFERNPLLGSGPSSISESSDGDYFRWIGEVGALGFMTFVYILLAIMYQLFKGAKLLRPEARMLIIAVICSVIGLLINALLIDVFEASKVAYILWYTLGIYIGLIHLDKHELEKL